MLTKTCLIQIAIFVRLINLFLKKYYNILGLEESASEAEIKTAYRKLALQFHPDVNPGSEAKFLKISEAYQKIINNKETNLSDLSTNYSEEKIFVRKYNKWLTKSEFEALKRATEFYQKKVLNEEEQLAKDFTELKNSIVYKSFKYIFILGLLFNCLLLADYIITPKQTKTIVTSFETRVTQKENPIKNVVYEIYNSHISLTDQNKVVSSVVLTGNVSNFIQLGDSIALFESAIFKVNLSLKRDILNFDTEEKKIRSFELFLILFIFGLIIFTPLAKGPTPLYYILLNTSVYGIPVVIALFFIITCFF